MRVRTAVITLVLASSAGIAGTMFAPAAMAGNVKTCSITTTSVSPGNGNSHSDNFTQTTTQTQTSACNSNSDTGSQTTTGPVTNPGGGTPPGQQ